jgi:hypothetical protein
MSRRQSGAQANWTADERIIALIEAKKMVGGAGNSDARTYADSAGQGISRARVRRAEKNAEP